MTSWKSNLENLLLKDQQDIDYLADTNTQAKKEDVGLINEENGAGILIKKDGSIEASSDYGLGFRLDPKYKSMIIMAPNLHIFSDNIEKHAAIPKGKYINNEYEEALRIIQNKG